jgi:hypothetical protein
MAHIQIIITIHILLPHYILISKSHINQEIIFIETIIIIIIIIIGNRIIIMLIVINIIKARIQFLLITQAAEEEGDGNIKTQLFLVIIMEKTRTYNSINSIIMMIFLSYQVIVKVL